MRHDLELARELYEHFKFPYATQPKVLRGNELQYRCKFLQEELDEFLEASLAEDLGEAADALADLAYVLYGTVLEMGLPWQPIMAAAHKANMSKVVGMGKRGHKQDLLKPAGWVAPDHNSVILNYKDHSRPILDEYFIGIAYAVARRSTCARRDVGCVLVDGSARVLSTGYNGVAIGAAHCKGVVVCEGATLPAGQDSCRGVHAEQNAILQCPNISALHTVYITHEPCKACAKLLLNTPAARVVFGTAHGTDTFTKDLWEAQGKTWEQFTYANA